MGSLGTEMTIDLPEQTLSILLSQTPLSSIIYTVYHLSHASPSCMKHSLLALPKPKNSEPCQHDDHSALLHTSHQSTWVLQSTLTNINLHSRGRHPSQLNRLTPRQRIQRPLRDIKSRVGVVDGQDIDRRGAVREFPASSALKSELSDHISEWGGGMGERAVAGRDSNLRRRRCTRQSPRRRPRRESPGCCRARCSRTWFRAR